MTDAETGKPIAGASVTLRGFQKGTATDDRGYYSLTLPIANYVVVFSAIGYRNETVMLTLTDNKKLDVVLRPVSKQLEEVIVTDKSADHKVKSTEMGTVRVDMLNIKKIPLVLGEADIIKALTLQAGVTTVGEGAGGFNVRGGRVDQNLVLLDGAPLFNTSHLLGFFTNLNPDLVQDAELYKGNFSARYGGRISSLLVMNTRAGNNEKWKFGGGVGVISSRFFAEGPLVKDKWTLSVGGRGAYPNWIIRAFPSSQAKGSRASFYDLNLRSQYRLNAKNLFNLSLYRSFDNFKFPEDTVYAWRSNVASVQWNRLITNNLSVNVNALYSGYVYDIEGIRQDYTFLQESFIQHREIKADFLYTYEEKHRLQFGGNHIWYALQAGDRQPLDNSVVNPKVLPVEKAREAGIYIDDEWTISPILSVQMGLRYSWFSHVGPRTVYRYENGFPRSEETVIDSTSYGNSATVKSYGGWEPRISVKVGLGAYSALKVGYSRLRQYIHLISNTTAITPIDFWKLSDSYIPPQIADQWAIGFFRNFSDNSIEASVEAFYKDIDNLVEYKDGAQLLLNPLLETQLLNALGRAYGVELSIAKNKGNLTGQVNYTYARSLVAVQTPFAQERVNDGEWFPSNFDKPHTVNVQVRLGMGRNWTFSSNFIYTTGRPATFPDGRYVLDDRPALNFSRRNADRIPDTHRLDISFSKDTRYKKEQEKYSVWTVAFYNVYGRRNPYSIYFSNFGQSVRSYRLSVFGSIIPSVTYNFYF